MLKDIVLPLFERDLRQLQQEISLFPNEQSLWEVRGDVKNSAGNLSLHLAGNLNHFIGHMLGQTGYIRQRDLEFSTQGVPREALLKQLEQTQDMLKTILGSLDESILSTEYPIQVFGYPMTTGYFLVHLTTHLSYHLGQVNYLRRML